MTINNAALLQYLTGKLLILIPNHLAKLVLFILLLRESGQLL